MAPASRVDSSGKAFSRSQYQIQTYINDHKDVLLQQLSFLFGEPLLEVSWLSPLAEQGYKEFWDKRALERLGLDHLCSGLSAFWPAGGPHWDALATCRISDSTFRLLIEAKSHIPEMTSHCTATSPVSLELISGSLRAVQSHLGVAEAYDWKSGYYQHGNRLAWLIWLQSHTPTRLVNIYFTDDEHAPTTSVQWISELALVKKRMGITAPVPGAYDLLLPALPYPDAADKR
jgi:hypothetical protein